MEVKDPQSEQRLVEALSVVSTLSSRRQNGLRKLLVVDKDEGEDLGVA